MPLGNWVLFCSSHSIHTLLRDSEDSKPFPLGMQKSRKKHKLCHNKEDNESVRIEKKNPVFSIEKTWIILSMRTRSLSFF